MGQIIYFLTCPKVSPRWALDELLIPAVIKQKTFNILAGFKFFYRQLPLLCFR